MPKTTTQSTTGARTRKPQSQTRKATRKPALKATSKATLKATPKATRARTASAAKSPQRTLTSRRSLTSRSQTSQRGQTSQRSLASETAAQVIQAPANPEFVTDLVASIEREAQQGGGSLAKQCQKLLQMLQVGAAFDQLKPETPSLRLELVRGDDLGGAGGTNLDQPRRARVSKGATSTALTTRDTIEDVAAVLAVASKSRNVRGLLDTLFPGRTESLRHKLFLTLREAADYSGLPLTAIRQLVRQNQLPAIKAGGWRVKRSYLERLELRHLRRLGGTQPS